MKSLLLPLLVAAVTSSSLFFTPAEAAVSTDVKNYLESLYDSLGGPTDWTTKTNWKTDDPCENSWYGIGCNAAKTEVTSISLPDNKLTGRWPTGIKVLATTLTQLDISNNPVTDEFNCKDTATDLTALQNLNISMTKLTKMHLTGCTGLVSLDASVNFFYFQDVEDSWSALTELQYFNIRFANFAGTLPSSWSQWTKIQQIDISENFFLSGSLPADWSAWTQVKNIQAFDINATGELPASWGNTMINLETLCIYNTSVGGTLPTAWQGMTNMTYFEAHHTRIMGQLPEEIFEDWVKLEYFNMEKALLWGTLPDTLPPEMAFLDLSDNLISSMLPTGWTMSVNPSTKYDSIGRLIDLRFTGVYGALPEQWSGMMISLSQLFLDNTHIGGDKNGVWVNHSLPVWAKMGFLEVLSLHDTRIASTLPQTWTTTMGALRYLDMSNNRYLYGPLPNAWTGVRKLEFLNLANCQLDGFIPTDVLGASILTNLTVLDLSANKFDSWSFSTWKGSMSLQELSVNDNYIYGTLPDNTDMPPNLTKLYLQNNRLIGSLPSGLADCDKLIEFYASSNRFTGTVPTTYWHKDLKVLNLAYNYLSGIPPLQYLFNLDGHGIEDLQLGSNNFTGSLPYSLAPKSSISPGTNWYLHTFNISNNRMSGPMPRLYGLDLLGLTTYDVRYNQLSGPFPDYSNSTAAYILAGDNTLSGPLPTNISGMIFTKELELGNNDLSGTLPPMKNPWYNMGYLGLSYNSFEGTLPEQWVTMMPDLAILRLTGNNLGGSVPESYTNFTKLAVLEIGLNQFEGPLPFQKDNTIGKNLQVLFFGSNNFYGTLPANWVTALPSLSFLNVASNYIHGTIPSKWAAWNVSFLCLEANFMLNGTLPASWGERNHDTAGESQLVGLSVAFTGIHGPFPTSWVNKVPLVSLNLQGTAMGGIPDMKFDYLTYFAMDYMEPCMETFPQTFMQSPNLRVLSMRRCGATGNLPLIAQGALTVLDISGNDWSGYLIPARDGITFDYMTYLNLQPTTTKLDPFGVAYEVNHFFFSREQNDFDDIPLKQLGPWLWRNPAAYNQAAVTGLFPISILPNQIFKDTFFPVPSFSFLVEVDGQVTDFKELFMNTDISLQYRLTISPYHPSDIAGPFPWGEWQTAKDLPNGLLFLKDIHFNARFGTTYTMTASFRISYNLINKVQEFTLSSGPMVRDPCTPTTFAVKGTHECMTCPAGAVCNGTDVILSQGDQWQAKPGYLPLVECDPNIQGCAPAGAQAETCMEGYNGFKCSNCDESAGYYKASRGCGKCNKGASTAGKIFMTLLVLLITVGLAYLVMPAADGLRDSRRETVLAIFKFVFNFFATMGLISYTDAAKRMAEVGFGTLDFEGFISGATFWNQLYWSCGFDTYNAETQLHWAVASFFILLAVTIIPIVVKGLKRPDSHAFWFYLVAGVASTLHLCFNALVATSFRVMDICDYFTFHTAAFLAEGHVAYRLPGYGTQTDDPITLGYLHSDPSLACSGDSRSSYLIGGVMVVFFLCGLFPVAIWAAHRRIMNAVDEDTASNVLYYYTLSYRSDTWYWEYVIFLRKIVIVSVVAFAPKYTQLTMLCAVFGLNLYLNERFRPFSSDRMAACDSLTIASAFLTVSIMSYALSYESTTTADAVLVLIAQLLTWAAIGYQLFKYVKGDDTVHQSSKYGGYASGEGIEGSLAPEGGNNNSSTSPFNARRTARPEASGELSTMDNFSPKQGEDSSASAAGGNGGYGSLN